MNRDLEKLMDIGGTFITSSAECGHAFSLAICKNKLKNQLQIENMEIIICVGVIN